MTTRQILIVGATGQQGKATIASLHAASDPSIRILALTRSASSPTSQALKTAFPDIELVEGDTRTPASVFESHPAIAAVFLVTVPRDEEAQAFPLIDAAVAEGRHVDHIVFSSVDRGGEAASWQNATNVPHFAAKHRIEQKLKSACEGSGTVRWTILRPTGFMDNYQPSGFFGAMMASMWKNGLPADRKMQLVSTHDIGMFAAKALLNPERWVGRAVGLAGDELTFGEARHIFKNVVKKDLPETWSIVAKGMIWAIEEARTSFQWFDQVGYGVDLEAVRKEEPRIQSFETWLRQTSRWRDEIEWESVGSMTTPHQSFGTGYQPSDDSQIY